MLFSALSSAPDDSRILYSTAIRMAKKGAPLCYLVSQEYSNRQNQNIDPAAFKQLIADLGHRDFKVRKAASEKLATLGAAAKKELIKAADNKDPEISSRAKALLERLFPECLKLQLGK